MLEKNLLLDKRIIKRNILQGRITNEEYQEFLRTLPDRAKDSVMVVSEVVAGSYKVDSLEVGE